MELNVIKHYRSEAGAYLGASNVPIEGGIECPPPEDARQIWDRVAVTWSSVALPDPLAQPLDRLTFWLAAAEIGVSKWSVRDKIALMPAGVDRDAAIAWFEEARQYRRHDPLLIQLAAAEGITEPQLDALWTWARGNATSD